MIRTKILLDCDPGHDDAIAIMLAGKSKAIDLLAITTESGNQSIDKTSRNAFNVAKYLNINVPIAVGVNHPIIKEPDICDAIHGASGLDGFSFPRYRPVYDKRNAVQMIIDTVMNNDNVVVVTTGAMTNLALAMRLEPMIISRIKKVVLMGGSMGYGNVSPAAEFNILCDPEAAYIVFNSGCLVEMIGLDVTRQVLVLPEIVSRMKKINNKASDLFTKLMITFNANQKKVFGLDGGPLHDPVTIVSLIDKKVVKFEKFNVTIDISHGPSYGRTNCDVFNYLHQKSNCYVATEIDVNRYWDVVESIIREY